MILEKIDRTIEFGIAYDVLDAAIHRCLSNTVLGFVGFEREEPTRATIIYMLKQAQLGIFGKIRIDKLGNERTNMSLFELREPFAPKQKQGHIENSDQDVPLSERKKKHYDTVVELLLNRLGQENIWSEKQSNNQAPKGDISIGKDMADSTIIQGNNNIVNINSQYKNRKTNS